MSPSNGLQNGGGGGGGGLNYLEHRVSKLDTLAGVAIKYGVEVADIKRMNGLATDLQMFALKTLRIPLPGRHPPSPNLPNGSAKLGHNSPETMSPQIGQSNIEEPFQSLRLKAPRQSMSPAMSTLQKYYGLKSSNPGRTSEGTEMAVYSSAGSDYFRDEWLPKASPMSDQPHNHPYKSGNLAYDLLSENSAAPEYVPLSEIGDVGGEKSDEKSVRRRQKAEVDNGAGTPERLLKEENSCGINGFSPSTGKGLAMRPKSASRSILLAESDSGFLDHIPLGLGESVITDGLCAVRKSSSTSSLREQEKNNSATVWPTGWSLKPDLPIFDGLPIPITGRRSKAALD
ncbi:LysM and putative peptidoglycan-binding domain-containing protein 2 [Senna tora]|uniref:LysM and putative peptidoglycan-binding domain-containing protein 2 n=1 Tax=Senna tora TaxID=362788 RepID=A0A834WKL5_9FABA|nr:LysM and putative peptidoglycan-binding domain-containing protein 2 [Senna tora]